MTMTHDERIELLLTRFKAAATPATWMEPHRSSEPYIGGINAVFEWWAGARKVTIDVYSEPVDGAEVWYTRVWGADVESEMASGVLPDDPLVIAAIWEWLLGGRS